MNVKAPALYGIVNSNRSQNDLWGKNQFNSAFPVSLACYMRDKGQKAVYLQVNEALDVVASEISFDQVFRSELPNSRLRFDFETKFDAYQQFSYDDIKGIDLVVSDIDGKQLHPLEIKLTVIPDSTTYKLNEGQWGSELVIRPATTTYSGLGMIKSYADNNKIDDIRSIIEPICSNIRDWGNSYEVLAKIPDMLAAIDKIQKKYLSLQKPALLQPIWKTQGKSPILCEDAFDIFVWSDYALSRLFLDNAFLNLNKNSVTRQTRSSARLANLFYQVSTTGKAKINSIYTEMAFSLQTDKEFAVSGRTTNNYMKSKRLEVPIIKRNELPNIILNGGENNLSPERRFDQTVYFMVASEKED